MVFAAGFATIRGVWAGFFASFGCFGEGGIDQGAFPIDLVGAIELGQEQGVELEPNAGVVPELQLLPTRFATPPAEFGGQIIPGDAGLEYEENAGEDHAIVERLARVSELRIVEQIATGVSKHSTANFDVAVIYERTVDVTAERERSKKEIARQEKIIANAGRQLGNPGFIEKAPAHIVEGLKKQLAEARRLLEKARGDFDALPPE